MARKIRRGWPGREPGYSLDIQGRICDSYLRESDSPDPGQRKSTRQQGDVWREWMPRAGAVPGRSYVDDDRSASPFATREREEFANLRADITAGRLDGHVLWFWTSSRQTRGDVPLDVIAAECVAHGIVWAVGGQVLNPANGKDITTAGLHNVMDKGFSYDLSDAVSRGKRDAALRGLPAAVPLYGYAREYEAGAHGQMVLAKGRPVIKGDVPCDLDEHGSAVPGTPAAVVREIFDRLEALDTMTGIAIDLETRRVPTPRRPRKCTTCGEKLKKDDGWYCTRGHDQDMCQWHPSAIRFIATNEGYLGRRIFQAESGSARDRRAAVLAGVEARWPPLVTERQFLAVQRILGDSGRARWRGTFMGAAGKNQHNGTRYLLVPAARCGGCGGALGGHDEKGRSWYKCRVRGCSTIRADWLEAYAEDRLVSWLVLPEVQAGAWSRDSDDAEIEAAQIDLERENAALKELLELAREGKAGSAALAAATEEGIRARIAQAEAKLRPRTAPMLSAMYGADVADKWMELKSGNLTAARQLMAEVATIYVRPAAARGGGTARTFDESRVEWHWNLGENASTPPAVTGRTEGLTARKNALAEARDRAAGMLTADPTMPDSMIGRELGIAYGTVTRMRRKLTDAGTITEPGYRVARNGKRFRVVDDPRRVTGRAPEWMPGGTVRRPAHIEAKRERIRAALAEYPGWSHSRIGRELGVAHDTVASVCAEQPADGIYMFCTHGREGQETRR